MQFDEHTPPDHLSDRAKTLWRRLVPHHVRAFSRVALLQSALEASDTADRARADLAAATLTTKTLGTGTIHVHPLVKVERENRAQFMSILASLGLNDPNLDGYCKEKWFEWQRDKYEDADE